MTSESVFETDLLTPDVWTVVCENLTDGEVAGLRLVSKSFRSGIDWLPRWSARLYDEARDEQKTPFVQAKEVYESGLKNLYEGKFIKHSLDFHSSYLMGLDVSGRGKVVTTAGINDGRTVVWSREPGRLPSVIGVAAQHTAAGILVRCCGDRAASVGYDGYVRLIDVENVKEIANAEIKYFSSGSPARFVADSCVCSLCLLF